MPQQIAFEHLAVCLSVVFELFPGFIPFTILCHARSTPRGGCGGGGTLIFLYILVGNPNRKKMHIFGFVGIFEYIC